MGKASLLRQLKADAVVPAFNASTWEAKMKDFESWRLVAKGA